MVAAVYTVAPFPRVPDDIVRDLNGDDDVAIKRKWPLPERKRIWASLEREVTDVVNEAFTEALARDPDLQKRR